MEKGKGKFGIATALTLAFGGLALISTGVLLFFSLNNTLEATRSGLGTRLETLINEAEQQSLAFYQPVENQARWLARQMAALIVSTEDEEQFSLVLKGVVSGVPQVEAVSYQFPDGTGYFYETGRKKLQKVTWPQNWRVQLNRSADNPQIRPPADGIWVLRPNVLDGETASTFIVPVRTHGGDLGVVAMRINLSALSQKLAGRTDYRGNELVRFILFNNRIVAGHPGLKGVENVNRPSIADVNDPFLSELADGKRERLAIVGDIPDVEVFRLDTEAGRRIFALKEDRVRQSGGQITIGVHFDPQIAAPEIRRLATVAGVGIALLLGSMILAYLLGRWAAQPIKELANAAQLVQNNRLDDVKSLKDSSVNELSSASFAFNAMVDGLKERAKIRDLFGKYVPQDVADLLLTDDKTAEPTNAEATVLFLDIVGFSSISEKMRPRQVVATMNAFFSEAVELIEEEHGMVTQFQGDAILAVFNVPIAKGDHSAAAIRAALEIHECIDVNTYAGEKLDCRIGINTGPLVAGAIGAQDRLSYTVYGDAVNVAARLEQMNKEFGTWLLVSEDTLSHAQEFLEEGVDFKPMGELPIRGREKGVEVFTLEG